MIQRRSRVLVATIAALAAAGGYLGLTLAADGEPEDQTSAAVDLAVLDSAGHKESLVLVVGGVYKTKEAAQGAAGSSSQGQLQGYYVAPTDEFRLTAAYADVQPAVMEVPCVDAAMKEATDVLAELEQIDAEQLHGQCHVLEDAEAEAENNGEAGAAASGEVPVLKIPLDTELERIPVTDTATKRSLAAGRWMTVSAFRTLDGAEEYLTFLRQAGQSVPPLTVQAVRVSGATDIGLGQEAHPDGSGPALDELPDQEELQE